MHKTVLVFAALCLVACGKHHCPHGKCAPPTLTVAVEPAPARDPSWPNPDSWRRDEAAYVRCDVNEPIADGGLTVEGATTGISLALPSSCEWATPCDAGTCACFYVDLRAVAFEKLSGDLAVFASVVNSAGQGATAHATLPLTRVRWVADAGAGAELPGSPAVTFDGKVIASTVNGTLGERVFYPDFSSYGVDFFGDGTSSPALLTLDLNFDPTLVLNGLQVPGQNYLRVDQITCDPQPMSCGSVGWDSIFSGPVTHAIATAPRERLGVFYADTDPNTGNPPEAMGWDYMDARWTYSFDAGPSTVTPAPGVVTDEHTFFFDDALGTVTGLTIDAGVADPQFDSVAFVASAVGGSNTDQISGQILLDSDGGLVLLRSSAGCSLAAGCPRLVAFDVSSGTARWSSGVGTAHSPVAIDESSVIFTSDSPPRLVKVNRGSVVTSTSLPETSVGSPVLGADGELYLVGTSGTLYVFNTATLAPRWHGLAPGLLETTTGSANLDCNRLGPEGGIEPRTGSLYFLNGGQAASIIVDSPTLDPNAVWPKFQHDAQNTGDIRATRNYGCP